jgi:hypothetical protein
MKDINSIVKMFSLFTGWLDKNEDDSHSIEGHPHLNLPEIKNIMNFDRGKLFKGHNGGLMVEGTKLRLVNCYYTNVVVQIYDTKDNILTTEYIVTDPIHPKYISKIVQDTKTITSNPATPATISYLIPINDSIDIELTEWSLRIIKTTKEKGLEFKNHWDNINELRTLRQYMSKFKKFLKLNSKILLTAKKNPSYNKKLYDESELIITGIKL